MYSLSMGMSFSYGPPKDKQEMIALLRIAAERGITFDELLQMRAFSISF
jgi:hypothetical protein